MSLGEEHAAGVSGDGEVYTWGKNDKGQLGQSAGENKDIPTKMEILRGWDVRAIACGAEHTVAITQEDVISWGSNEGMTRSERCDLSFPKSGSQV